MAITKRKICPPFESMEGKSYYETLNDSLSNYICYLHMSKFDEILSDNDYLEFEKIKEDVLLVIKLYLSGQSGESYKRFELLISKISDDWTDLKYTINSENAYIRIRTTTESLNKRREMFHVPFDKRQLITKQRFSIEGYPCLYLAGCAYTAWLELNRPQFDTIWASSFRPTKGIDLLDLSYTIDYLENNFNIYETNHLKSLIKLYFIVISTSYRVKYPSAYFHEEYILSGLLLQWLSLNKHFSGIRYLSTKLEYYDPDKLWCASNIVVPPNEYDFKEKFNEYLKKLFVLTLPQHWSVLMSYSNAGSVACLECGGDFFKEKTPYPFIPNDVDFPESLDKLIFNNYNATWFYNIDGYLRSQFKMDYIEDY